MGRGRGRGRGYYASSQSSYNSHSKTNNGPYSRAPRTVPDPVDAQHKIEYAKAGTGKCHVCVSLKQYTLTSILTLLHDRGLHPARIHLFPPALCGMGRRRSYRNMARSGVGDVSCLTSELRAENLGLLYLSLSM